MTSLGCRDGGRPPPVPEDPYRPPALSDPHVYVRLRSGVALSSVHNEPTECVCCVCVGGGGGAAEAANQSSSVELVVPRPLPSLRGQRQMTWKQTSIRDPWDLPDARDPSGGP